MNNAIYCSTGTMVGRVNDFNLDIFLDAADKINCAGFEFMMYPVMYERYPTDIPKVIEAAKQKNISFPVIHTDKDIGIWLSCSQPGWREKAFEAFDFNCKIGEMLGSRKAVLHLWGGDPSDRYVKNNISCVPELFKIAGDHGLLLVIENVPCAKGDPLTHWGEIKEAYPDAKFIYDTRFSAFHEQHNAFLDSGFFTDGSIEHIHVSDYTGPAHSFDSLRPIPHLGKGSAGLDSLLADIFRVYHGSVTLESPEIHPDRTYPDRINEDIAFIRKRCGS